MLPFVYKDGISASGGGNPPGNTDDKKLPPLLPASRVLLGRSNSCAASSVLNWHREMSGGGKNIAIKRSC